MFANLGLTRVPTEVEVVAVVEETGWEETDLEGEVDDPDSVEVVVAVDGLDLLEVSTLLLFHDASLHISSILISFVYNTFLTFSAGGGGGGGSTGADSWW